MSFPSTLDFGPHIGKVQVSINKGNAPLLETGHSLQKRSVYNWEEAWRMEETMTLSFSPLLPGTDNKHPYNKTITFNLHIYKSTGLKNCLWSSHHWHAALLPSPPATSDLTQPVYVGLMTLWEQQLLFVLREEVIQHDRPWIWQNPNLRPWIWEIQVLSVAVKQEWFKSFKCTKDKVGEEVQKWFCVLLGLLFWGIYYERRCLYEYIILHWVLIF